MPVDHVVFFKLSDSDANKIESLKTQLLALQTSIEGVQSINFGKNVSPDRAQGYNYALRATFDSKETIQYYATHPEHQKVVVQLKELFEAPPICLDWEF